MMYYDFTMLFVANLLTHRFVAPVIHAHAVSDCIVGLCAPCFLTVFVVVIYRNMLMWSSVRCLVLLSSHVMDFTIVFAASSNTSRLDSRLLVSVAVFCQWFALEFTLLIDDCVPRFSTGVL